MTRHELIARLEAATAPDVSLDIAIHSFINAGKRIRTDRHGFPMDVKGYTHSIGAAATLVPAGLQGYVGICGNRLAGVWRKKLMASHNSTRSIVGSWITRRPPAHSI